MEKLEPFDLKSESFCVLDVEQWLQVFCRLQEVNLIFLCSKIEPTLGATVRVYPIATKK